MRPIDRDQPDGTDTPANPVRLDVWLDIACLFRTRSEAQRAVKGGKVAVNGTRAKSNREVRPGDELRITRSHGVTQVISVTALADRHIPKNEARALYDDRTPPLSEDERDFRQFVRRVAQANASNRPDKRQRRQLRSLKGHS